mmetsp:Transcript_22134/g.34278  ORF Transcript_22134/g.34278 Transcript_22134/m.34278 type:complete len:93 (+) Transcript_22134:188-466(+)|eukprot:CAMPEP_0170508578 /NCGR_PEP_ID=MMETSP0208-20121228/62800_1 /TAXON_ID=197538 /ORGANISM="Strombidium inclinatum, Strain S3" /LENGTH=92 /DNA_ID=CAMNT_0010791557 /DNA_START=162 /DNA_END=440 /DNA_ORIENTATION=-
MQTELGYMVDLLTIKASAAAPVDTSQKDRITFLENQLNDCFKRELKMKKELSFMTGLLEKSENAAQYKIQLVEQQAEKLKKDIRFMIDQQRM